MDSRADEQKRVRRVVDQSITAYSYLRDRALRWSRVLIAVVLALNIAILMVALVPSDQLDLDVAGGTVRAVIAVASGIAFFMALLLLVLRLDIKAAEYANAADAFAAFKLKLRSQTSSDDFDTDYRVLQASQPRIPERQLLRSKIRHTRKIRVSQLIDDSPGIPYWAAWLVIVWRAVKGDNR